jgi:hypothetical protein
MDRLRLFVVVWSLSMGLGFVAAPSSFAQAGFAGGGARHTFGTVSEVAHVVGAWQFNEYAGTPTTTGSGELSCIESCGLMASVMLPSGARVGRIELDACDAVANAEIHFLMGRIASPAFPTTVGSVNLTPIAGTGDAATPGCAVFPIPLTTPVTIDNAHFTYFLNVLVTAGDVNLNFTAVRVYYTLQVSPAPATATFGDVPTSHPFFRFVEALVASGITAGCGGGLYCPDEAVTRGQMAVFLSKALGLQFAP